MEHVRYCIGVGNHRSMEDNEMNQQQLQAAFEAMRQRAQAAEVKLAERAMGAAAQSPHWIEQLGQAIRTIQAAQSYEDVWRSLANGFELMLGGEGTAVYFKNETTGQISCPYAHGISRHLRHNFQDTINDYFAIDADISTPIVVNNIHKADQKALVRTALVDEAIHGYVLNFLIVADQLCGVVAIFREDAKPFTENEIRVGQILGQIGSATLNMLSIVIEAEDTREREHKRNEITHTLSSALDLPTILQNVGRIATELIGADAGLLGLVIDNQMMIFYPHNIPAQMNLRPAAKGRGVAWKIVEECQSILLDNYMNHPLAQQKWTKMAIRSFIGVPVFSNEECLGALTVFNTSDKKLTRRDLALVESIGQQAGIAIQNARMFAEVKQRAAALANTLNRQEELDKLKNQFIQTVSHELRSPLGIIFGHAELLESGDLGSLTDIQKSSIEIISRRIRMLTDLVDDLTALMAAETQEFRRDLINPSQLLYAMVAEYRMQSKERGVALTSEIPEGSLWIQGDLTQLRRVFDNLLSNAFKFTDKGGTIAIRLKVGAQKVVIEVEDSGEGIAKDHLPRIFERFYQVTDKQHRPRRKGTGLGLSLVKEIIEAHRGEVFIASELGVGTTFRIELPGYEPPERNRLP